MVWTENQCDEWKKEIEERASRIVSPSEQYVFKLNANFQMMDDRLTEVERDIEAIKDGLDKLLDTVGKIARQ